MKHDAEGNELFKTVELVYIFPEGTRPDRTKIVVRAEPGRYFNGASVAEILDRAEKSLAKRFPRWEFRLIERGRNAFTFAYAGLVANPLDVTASNSNSSSEEVQP